MTAKKILQEALKWIDDKEVDDATEELTETNQDEWARIINNTRSDSKCRRKSGINRL